MKAWNSTLNASTKPMKRSRIAPVSKKRRILIAEFSPERRAFIEVFGQCMICGLPEAAVRIKGIEARLVVHEICRGTYREKAFQERSVQLVVCDGFPDSCHKHIQDLPLADQLAFKLYADPWWFDLDVVRRVRDTGRHPEVVNMADIRLAAKEIGLMNT